MCHLFSQPGKRGYLSSLGELYYLPNWHIWSGNHFFVLCLHNFRFFDTNHFFYLFSIMLTNRDFAGKEKVMVDLKWNIIVLHYVYELCQIYFNYLYELCQISFYYFYEVRQIYSYLIWFIVFGVGSIWDMIFEHTTLTTIPCYCYFSVVFNHSQIWEKNLYFMELSFRLFTFLPFYLYVKGTILYLFNANLSCYLHSCIR